MHSSRLNLFIGFVLLLGAFPARAQEGDRPNIIFIFSDDHATEALGAYGGPLASLNPTPNLDRLADQGMLFGMRLSPIRSAHRAGPLFFPASTAI